MWHSLPTWESVFVLYLQSKFGWSATQAGHVYGGFLFGIYFLPLLGGFIADNVLGYGKTIVLGIIVMFIGYVMLAVPGRGQWFIYGALAVISLGTGLFKGNLQALVGNLYDEAKYSKLRDSAFNIFYMGINIGAFFAPSAARGMRSWVLKLQGLHYDAAIPSLANKYLNGTLENTKELSRIAHIEMGSHFTSLTDFSHHYINALSKSYNAGFAVAAASMILSIVIFLGFRKYYKHADITHKEQKAKNKESVVELTRAQTKDRLMALGLVFLVVIFFWMAFHQNGFTLTIFARDYTVGAVNKATAIIFNLSTFLPVLLGILGIVLLAGKNNSAKVKLSGAIIAIASAIVAYFTIRQLQSHFYCFPDSGYRRIFCLSAQTQQRIFVTEKNWYRYGYHSHRFYYYGSGLYPFDQPARPGTTRRCLPHPSFAILAHQHLFYPDHSRTFPEPYRNFLCFKSSTASV